MQHDEEVQRRREDMEAQVERATAQNRHLQDDVKAVRAEVRERTERADRLKIKYDHMIKALGGGGGSGEGEDKKSEEGKDKEGFQSSDLDQGLDYHSNFAPELIIQQLAKQMKHSQFRPQKV